MIWDEQGRDDIVAAMENRKADPKQRLGVNLGDEA